MSDIPSELKYTQTHEWAKLDDEGAVIIGITDHAQDLLGDLVFVELPEIGSEIRAGDEIATIESVKAASDIYAPVTGEVIEINEALVKTPELINKDPYHEGWLLKLKPDDEEEINELLDAGGYQELIDSEAH